MEPRQDRVIDIQGSESAPQPAVATYSIEVACNNCNYRGETQIPKGTLVGGSPCPNCGCQTVVKSLPDRAEAPRQNTRNQIEEMIRRQYGTQPDRRVFHSLVPIGQVNRNGDMLLDGSFAHGHVIGSWDRNFGVAPVGPPRTVGVTTDADGFVRPVVEGEQAIGTIDLDSIGDSGDVRVTPGVDPDHMRALANAANSGMISQATMLERLGLPASLLAGDRPAEVPRVDPGNSAILNEALNGRR